MPKIRVSVVDGSETGQVFSKPEELKTQVHDQALS